MVRIGYLSAVCAFLLLFSAASAAAQQQTLKGGYAARAAATVTGDELSGQTNLWVLEVEFKPPRMVSMEVTDPRTGEKKLEWIWYLAYKATNRPITRRADETDTEPQNDYDVQPKKPLFVPEFTLVTSRDEGGPITIQRDAVLPEVGPAIEAREKRKLKNSVTAVREIPDPAPVGEPADDVIYGVATWRGVDPETDFFTLFMSGFSNGYRIVNGPDDKPLVERRTLMQQFWRPGDSFDQKEIEIRLKGLPQWIYRADEPKESAAPMSEPAPAQP